MRRLRSRDRSPGTPGRIVTFYSYKGGTGRSMAVANVAWMLALNGNRVLVIDWDLEAPGIHRYFHPFLEDKDLRSTAGLLDMVENLAAHAATSSTPLGADQVDIIDYIEPLEWPRSSTGEVSWKRFGPRARIDLMPAGRQGPAYSRKLSAFNWIDFYEKLDGRRLLETARTQMRSIYDYVLIDSRTGVSDTSGICTVEMPDLLVICFTLNDQSIRGAEAIAESVREQWTRRREAGDADEAEPRAVGAGRQRMFFVPTRVEITSERDKRETALDLAQRTFAPFLDHLPQQDHGRYWGAVQMAYFPYYAFEEIPAVFGDKPNDRLSLASAIKEITRIISDPPVAELPVLSKEPVAAEEIRREIVGWHLRPSVRQTDVVRLAQATYDASDPEGRDVIMRVLLRLVVLVPASGPAARHVPLEELGAKLADSALFLWKLNLLALSDAQGSRAITFKDPTLIEEWEPLQRAIQANRAFLEWRTALSATLESWLRSQRDESALLRGRVLDEARAWLVERPADLSATERAFIENSREANEHLQRAEASARARSKELEEWAEAQRALSPNVGSTQRMLRSWRFWLQRGLLTVVVGGLAVLSGQWYEGYRARRGWSCPGAELITAAWLRAAGPSTFKTSGALSLQCVLAARDIGNPDWTVLEQALSADSNSDPEDGTTSALFVTSVLRANGLDVNPLRCDVGCLRRGLPTTESPAPGSIVIAENKEGGPMVLGLLTGYDGDILGLPARSGEPQLRKLSYLDSVDIIYLDVPYDFR